MNARGAGENLRNDLVVAATDLLTTAQDVPCPSLRSVARKVGVAPSAVYLHFSSQADLVLAVVTSLLDQLWSTMGTADDENAAPLERMMRFATSYTEWSMAHRGGYQLLFERADLRPLSALGPVDLIGQHNGGDSSISSAEQVRARVAGICAEVSIAQAEQDAHTIACGASFMASYHCESISQMTIGKPRSSKTCAASWERYSPRARPPSVRNC